MLRKILPAFILVLLVSACTPAPLQTEPPPVPSATAQPATLVPTQAPTGTATPTLEPSATAAPPTQTATAAATKIPRESGSTMTEDGERIFYTIYGQGSTAVIFSNMSGSTKGEWREAAEFLAQQGLFAMTYDYREGITNLSANAANGHLDLRAIYALAIDDYAVEEVFFIAASMGGPITVRAAADLEPAGIALLSAPFNARSASTDAETIASIATTWLFVNTQGDGFYEDTLAMHEAAPDPKSLHIYQGDAHGTHIFNSDHGQDLLDRLLEFIISNSTRLDN
jgi:hypothetical protein